MVKNILSDPFRLDKEYLLAKMGIPPVAQAPKPLKDSNLTGGNVSVTMTLTATAAEDIQGVLTGLADLLKIQVPTSYEIIDGAVSPSMGQTLEALKRRSKFRVVKWQTLFVLNKKSNVLFIFSYENDILVYDYVWPLFAKSLRKVFIAL